MALQNKLMISYQRKSSLVVAFCEVYLRNRTMERELVVNLVFGVGLSTIVEVPIFTNFVHMVKYFSHN